MTGSSEEKINEGQFAAAQPAQTPRGWARELSNSKKGGFLGNQHIAPAAWSEHYEDVWTFSKATTKISNKKMVVRVSKSLLESAGTSAGTSAGEEMYLLVELTCTAKQTTSSPRQEMSCGWCCIPLNELKNDGVPISKKTFPLQGGSMADVTTIKQKEILQRRKGLRSIPKLFTGQSQPSLTLHSIQISKLDRFEQETMNMLPPTIIASISSLPLLRCYRTLFIKANNKTHVVSNPALNIFPAILDHPRLFELLGTFF